MRTHDDDPELDALLADVVTHLGRGASERPRPDFREVVARAHREAPEAVDAAMVEESARLAPVVPLIAGGEAAAQPDHELDAFVADVRRAGDAAVHERRLAGIPALAVAGAPRPRGRFVVAAAASLAVAAALLLMILPEAATRLAGADRRPTQALMQGALDGARAIERQVADERRRLAHFEEDMSDKTDQAATPEARTPAPAAVEAAAEGGPAAAAAPAGEAGARTPGRRRPPRRAGAPAPAPGDAAPADELAALDAEAQALWRQGDRKGAESRFRALIERDPRGRWAQLAYGDLFALARQRGDEAAELALWREYLARYPRGTHSDDARAGLCRRSAGGERRRCWEDYLRAAPGGAYRSQAERELAELADGDEPTP